jgi:hypothetical protein
MGLRWDTRTPGAVLSSGDWVRSPHLQDCGHPGDLLGVVENHFDEQLLVRVEAIDVLGAHQARPMDVLALGAHAAGQLHGLLDCGGKAPHLGQS